MSIPLATDVMTPTTTDTTGFQASFARLDATSPIHAARADAWQHFGDLGFPTRRDEAWRHTNIKPVATTPFVAADDMRASVTAADAWPHTLHDTDRHELVFVNGRFAPDLSSPGSPTAGVQLRDLAGALDGDFAAVEPHLARHASCDAAFTALNTAFLEDGALLHLPANAVLERPVHLLFLTAPGSKPAACHPRVLVVAERGSQATIVETYAALGDAPYFTNTVTEIVAGEGAILDHYRIEEESEEAFHISALEVLQRRSSRVTAHSFCVGGKLVRNDVHARLDDEDCESTFNGLYLGHGEQLFDNRLRIDHLKPHCRSWEYYKGVLDDRSRAVFCGRIYVAEDAQKTDAKQTNQNLLLSDHAHVDTKPQLEIFADDVKCTHGATIGQLEESQLFYLRARGIPEVAARGLLIHGFANETISEIRVPEVRHRLEQSLLSRLPQVGGPRSDA